jgi:hypothetical protein
MGRHDRARSDHVCALTRFCSAIRGRERTGDRKEPNTYFIPVPNSSGVSPFKAPRPRRRLAASTRNGDANDFDPRDHLRNRSAPLQP